MPEFRYTAVDATGRELSGTIVAESRAAVVDEVVEQSLYPTSVAEAQAGGGHGPVPGGRISKSSVDAFTRELANLLAAGIPLSRALRILAQEASQETARRQWDAVREDVVGGMPLADALARWPRQFPPVYVAMVRAGETGGFLDMVLAQIADFRQRERDLKGKVTAALVYPAVLAVLAAGIMTFLLAYFIPRFTTIFASFGGQLPWLTRQIVAVSHFVVDHKLTLLLAISLAVVTIQRALASESGRRVAERTVLRIPALGRVVARFALVRFCRMLGTLLGAGVPLVTALSAAREAIGNQVLADTVSRSVEAVQKGNSLARSLGYGRQLFPLSVIEMISVGEETGTLDKELIRLAEANETELDRRLRMLVALAEPALLFVMAALIGTVVIGMLLPVFTLQEFIR